MTTRYTVREPGYVLMRTGDGSDTAVRSGDWWVRAEDYDAATARADAAEAERDEARDLAGIAQMERDDARRQRDAAEAMLDDLNASFGAVCAERDALAANLKKVSDVVGEYGRDEDEHSPCSAFGGPLENLRVAASAVEAWMNSAKAVGQGGPYHGRWHRVSHGDDVPCFGCLLEEMFAALHVIRGGPPPARPDKPPMACSNPKGGDDDG